MSPDPIDSLYERFPLTFRRVARDEPFTCYGFECDDGWTGIVARFAEVAEPILAADPAYVSGLPDEDGSTPQLVGQVKEKFGGIRIYAGTIGWPQVLYDTLRECEALAWHTCEECGAPGELRRGGCWLKVRCDGCQDERQRLGPRHLRKSKA